MSKLSDKIRKALRLEPAPLGFRAAARERTRSLVVVVRLDDADPKKIAAAIEKGADIILLRLAKAGEKEAKEAVEAAGETPCGVWSEVLDSEAASRLAAGGCRLSCVGGGEDACPGPPRRQGGVRACARGRAFRHPSANSGPTAAGRCVDVPRCGAPYSARSDGAATDRRSDPQAGDAARFSPDCGRGAGVPARRLVLHCYS